MTDGWRMQNCPYFSKLRPHDWHLAKREPMLRPHAHWNELWYCCSYCRTVESRSVPREDDSEMAAAGRLNG